MDRFSISWRYSRFTPSKLYHQRTIRFTLVSFTHQRLFVFFCLCCSLIRFLKPPLNLFLWFLILNFSSLIVLFITGRFFFTRIIYIYIIQLELFDSNVSGHNFLCLFLFRFILLIGEWIGSDKLSSADGCVSLGFHSPHNPRESCKGRSHTFPPSTYSRQYSMKVVFRDCYIWGISLS